VRQAFRGWENYFRDREAINDYYPTYQQVRDFLEKYPHYARNYWRNLEQTDYLKTLTFGEYQGGVLVAVDQLAPFLKAALYNDHRRQ